MEFKNINKLKKETESEILKKIMLEHKGDGETYNLELLRRTIDLTLQQICKEIKKGCDLYDSKNPELTRSCGDILFDNTIWICPRCKELLKKFQGEKK